MTKITINRELQSLSQSLELLKLLNQVDDKVDVSCYAIFLLVCFQE